MAGSVRHDLASKAGRAIARLLPIRLHRTRAAPLVSLTFDDMPDTTFVDGAPLLDGYGARGIDGRWLDPGQLLSVRLHDTRLDAERIDRRACSGSPSRHRGDRTARS